MNLIEEEIQRRINGTSINKAIAFIMEDDEEFLEDDGATKSFWPGWCNLIFEDITILI